ncbi:hypothetical protein wTpre_258 [Wolbachia endosymbiont of Trichogramma pretiosum]|nr:hypothetical protein wTpre_258 [Wolbachia endosymbiont of Trichogramma pretiosum]
MFWPTIDIFWQHLALLYNSLVNRNCSNSYIIDIHYSWIIG